MTASLNQNDLANALRDQPAARQVIKRSRWLLLRNRNSLDEAQSIRLDELLAADAPLATVYLLKTASKDVWFAPSVPEGTRRWRNWYRMSIDSGLAPLILFAKRLKKYLRGILASARFPMNTSILERMFYGLRSQPNASASASPEWKRPSDRCRRSGNRA